MVQREDQTTMRAIKLPLEMPQNPTKILLNVSVCLSGARAGRGGVARLVSADTHGAPHINYF